MEIGHSPVRGRGTELAILAGLTDAARRGTGQCVIVTGGQGADRTAVLDWVAAREAERGSAVLRPRIRDSASVLGAVGELLGVSTPPNADVYLRFRQLHHALSELTGERPVYLLIDDLPGEDTEAFRWLDFVCRRRDHLRLCIVAATRQALNSRCEVVRLGAQSADADLVTAAKLHDLPDHVRAAATAIAVLGRTEPDLVAALAGLSQHGVTDALGVLERELWRGQPEQSRVGTLAAVLDGVSPEQLAGLRVRAAVVLQDSGRTADEVARQLVGLDHIEPWMSRVLVAAATSKGTARERSAYLTKALEGAPTSLPLRVRLATELARTDPTAALPALSDVYTQATDPAPRVRLAVMFALTSRACGRPSQGRELLRHAAKELDAAPPRPEFDDLRTYLDAVLLALSLAAPSTATPKHPTTVTEPTRQTTDTSPLPDPSTAIPDHPTTIIEPAGRTTDTTTPTSPLPNPPTTITEPAGRTAAERCLLATLADSTMRAGGPLDHAVRQARLAVSDPDHTDDWSTPSAALVLRCAGQFGEAVGVLDHAVAYFAECGDELGEARLLTHRARVLIATGDLRLAEWDAMCAFTIAARNSWLSHEPRTALVLALAKARLGQADAAARLIDGVGHTDEYRYGVHYAMAWVHTARRNWQAAIDELFACGRAMADSGLRNPVLVAWWADAAILASALADQPARAAEALEHGVDLARQWRTPEYTALVTMLEGLVTPGKTALLAEAVEQFAVLPTRLWHAFAEFLLGRALVAAGDHRAARQHLRGAIDLALKYGHEQWVPEAHRLLQQAGGRMRVRSPAEHDVLTASERRVVEMAVGGAANREIAEALFVSLRTVELHLTRAYRKLGVSGRAQLREAAV